jgi:hypothetical protein
VVVNSMDVSWGSKCHVISSWEDGSSKHPYFTGLANYERTLIHLVLSERTLLHI